MLFSIIDDKQGIIRNAKSGVYKQVKLYEREGMIYAGTAGGFVRLLNDNRTSHPAIKWEALELEYARGTGINGGLTVLRKPALRVARG